MAVSNIVLAVSDVLVYLLEGNAVPGVRLLMITGCMVFYTGIAFFPFLFLLYLDYRCYQDSDRIRKMQTVYCIPCAVLFALLLINLKTGWIFTVGEDNIFHAGILNNLVFLPVAFYYLVLLHRIRSIDACLLFPGILLIAAQAALWIWIRDISVTAFIYTLILACVHIRVMNQPLSKETP